jgi:ABC-type nitrate/sulfonate/bicarbonate transport system substrate-binding protein
MNLHTKLHEAATIIARYVYPDCEESAAAAVGQRFFIEPQARLDVADVERQIAWYKAQGLIAKGVNARAVVDLNFVK